MQLFSFSHRHCDGSLRERRLCHQHPPGGPSAAPGGAPQSWWEKILGTGEEVVAAVAVPTGEFLRTLPGVGSLIEKYDRTREAETLRKLTDHANWITVFRDHPEVLEGGVPAGVPQNEGSRVVLEFIQTLSPADRQRVFLEYVDRYIPEDVRKDARFSHYFGPDGSGSEERFRAMKGSGNLSTVRGALGGILGVEDPKVGGADREIAVASLQSHYKIDPADPTKYSNPLLNDFRGAAATARHGGFPGGVVSPENMARGLAPSQFLGALKLGVVPGTLLTQLEGIRQSEKTEGARVSVDVGGRISRVKERREMAEGLREVYANLGGTEKLILFGLLIGMLASKKMRGLLAAGAVGYFAYKFYNKGKDPLEAADEGLRKMRGEGATLEKGAEEARAIMEFLSQQDRENMEVEGRGFGLLGEMPVQYLAAGFKIEGGGAGTTWRLDIDEPGSDLRKELQKRQVIGREYREFFDAVETGKAKIVSISGTLPATKVSALQGEVAAKLPGVAVKVEGSVGRSVQVSLTIPSAKEGDFGAIASTHGFSIKAREEREIDVPMKDSLGRNVYKYRPAVEEALSYVFFEVAKENPRNQNLVKKVEHGLRDLPSGKGYPALTSEAREAYIALVTRGREMSTANPQPLGKYLLSVIEARRKAFERKPEGPKTAGALLFPTDEARRKDVERLEAGGWRFFTPLMRTDLGELVKVEAPPGTVTRVPLLDRGLPYFSSQARLRDVIQKPNVVAALEEEQNTLMKTGKMAEKLQAIYTEANIVGSPNVVAPGAPGGSFYNEGTRMIMVQVVGGPLVEIPAAVWISRLYEGGGMRPAQIVAKEAVQFLPGIPAMPAPRIDPPLDTSVLGDLGAWTGKEDTLRFVLLHDMRFKGGILRAIHQREVAAGGRNIRQQLESIQALSAAGGARKIDGINDMRVTLEKDPGGRGFIPVYRFEITRAGRREPEAVFRDTEGIIDRNSN